MQVSTMASAIQALETRFRLVTFSGAMVPTAAALALQFVTFAVTARGLGAAQFGVYSAVLAVVGVGIEMVGVGGADLLSRAVSRNRATFRTYYGNLLLSSALTLPLVVAGGVAVAAAGMHIPLPLWLAAMALSGEILIGRMSASLELVMVAHRHVVRAGWVRMSTVLARLLAASGYFVACAQHSLAGWIALVCAQSLLMSGAYALIGATLYGRPRLALITHELGDGMAFSLTQTTRAMQSNIDRMVLSRFADGIALGAYGAASRVLQLGLFPIQIVTRTTYANFFVHGQHGLAASRRYALRVAPAMLAVGLLATLGVIVAAAAAAPALGHEFAASRAITARLACALPLIALQYPAADALTGAGLQGWRVRICSLSAVGSGVLLLAGVKLGGVDGLIYAFLLAQLLNAGALWICAFVVASPPALISAREHDDVL